MVVKRSGQLFWKNGVALRVPNASFETSGRGVLVLTVACCDGGRLKVDASIVSHVLSRPISPAAFQINYLLIMSVTYTVWGTGIMVKKWRMNE